MNEDRRLLLAAAIGEWTSAIEHMTALERLGTGGTSIALDRARRERALLCHIWCGSGAILRDGWVDRIVAEARTFATERVSRLDELLREKDG